MMTFRDAIDDIPATRKVSDTDYCALIAPLDPFQEQLFHAPRYDFLFTDI